MNRTDFDALVAETTAATAALLIAKGAEYANDADRLANFKRNAVRSGSTILDTWSVYWNKHIDAIHSYMERVKDTAVQLAIKEIVTEHGAIVNFTVEDLDRLTSGATFRRSVDSYLPVAIREVNKTLSEPIECRFHDNINYSYLCLAILQEMKE